MRFKKFLELFECNKKSVENPKSTFEFVDLMPVNFADEDKSYSKALEFALESERIKNIALTGPFGAGKSSIIKTFEENNKDKYSFLSISLASFKEDESTNQTCKSQDLLIEKSILQQMLYGSDANSLPYSRFKRILIPSNPFAKSLFIVVWAASAYIFQKNKEVLFKIDFTSLDWWLYCVFVLLLIASTAAIVSEIYKATFGVSFKKISLKNGEIETGNHAEDSILNRHLDEIIYFFQMTDYNVVVIEDLDRFADSEIFVKLREINKLINDSANTNKTVKFLYALKDDMFHHKNRVKFFDFIIPVVPIINRSNSLDKMQKRIDSLSFEGKITEQFLRDISLYIEDLRLIHNICNEFLIYYDRVKSKDLDVTKLMAMMVYKNAYPSDFESLHHEKGLFYKIVESKPSKIKEVKKNLNDSIASAEQIIRGTDDNPAAIKELQRRIKQLEKEILELSQIKLSELINLYGLNIRSLAGKEFQLLEYLIKNGHLDETYYLYISNFHEGRVTQNDRNYLITIKNFNQPDPNQPIDNPKEICADMREEDFGHKYVLNVTLIDHLFVTYRADHPRINNAFQYISENYKKSEKFVDAYLVSGENLELFVRKLCETWPNFLSEAISSKQAPEIVSYILRFVNKGYVASKMNESKILSSYLEKNGGDVFCSNIKLPDDYSILKDLNVKVSSLQALETNKELVNYLYEENLYNINSENINYILQKFSSQPLSSEKDPEQANYTSIGISGSDFFKAYIDNNLVDYIKEVFLLLPDNSKESEDVITQLIKSKSLDEDLKKKVLSKQDHIFTDLDSVPDELCKYVLKEGKVNISWENISYYLKIEDEDEDEDEEFITDYIQDDSNFSKLSNQKISIDTLGQEDAESLSTFLFNANAISDDKYCKIIKCLAYRYLGFPSAVSQEKLLCLAKGSVIKLTEKSFNTAIEDSQLVSALIVNNFGIYLNNKEAYQVGDDVRELLLMSEISNDHKIKVSYDVSVEGALNRDRLLSLMTDILLLDNVSCTGFDNQILSEAIIKSSNEDISIRLLVKCLTNWEKSTSMNVISQLGYPYSKIASNGKRPKLKKTPLNIELSKLLQAKGFISSFSEDKNQIRINTRRA
jgi:alanine-alpha-ketoisovalerate/valine-pyruvate aminotransferase